MDFSNMELETMGLLDLCELQKWNYEKRLHNLDNMRKCAELNLKVAEARHKLEQLQRSLVEQQQLYIINEN